MAQTKHVTIAQVAAKAGTSPASVSYVFNGRQGAVGEVKRRRILQVADELGYRPNRRARQLRKQANLVITVQIDSSIATNNGWRPNAVITLSMVQGISSYITERGYHMHLIVPPPGQDYREITDHVLAENAADGVVLFGLGMPEAQRHTIVEGIRRCRLPAVTLDRQLAAEGIPRVSTDMEPAIDAAAQRIVERGHQRIAYIGKRSFGETVSEWVNRYDLLERSLASRGAAIDPSMVMEQLTEVGGYEAACALVDRDPRPTCIICTGDHLAMAAAQALITRGLTPGRDVSLVTFGNAPYIAASPVPLAAIDQRHFEQGVMLARVLLDQIDRPDVEPPAVTLARARFIQRESLGPAPA